LHFAVAFVFVFAFPVVIPEGDLLRSLSFFPQPQKPGCPILRGLIAKGGMKNVQPAKTLLPLLLLLSTLFPLPLLLHFLTQPKNRHFDRSCSRFM
jgi:hypothetical protein